MRHVVSANCGVGSPDSHATGLLAFRARCCGRPTQQLALIRCYNSGLRLGPGCCRLVAILSRSHSRMSQAVGRFRLLLEGCVVTPQGDSDQVWRLTAEAAQMTSIPTIKRQSE